MKKHVQNPNEMYKKTKKKGFLRATAFMMAFMLLLGSVDVSAFAAQNENDETQTVSVQPEEDTNDVVEPKVDDDSTAVEESKEDADEDSGKEPDESLSSENPSDDDSDIKEEEKSEADVEENEIEKTEIEDDSEKEETVEEESEEVEEQAVNYDDQIAVFAGSGVKYEPLTVVSGFNADIVWTAGESQPSGALMDDVGASLYSVSQRSTGGIPNNGIITSCQNSNLKWQIADFKSNNALRLTNGRSGKLTFNKIGCYQTIYFLVTAGGLGSGKSATMHTTITYTDGEKSTSTFTVRDWWDNFNAATTQGQYGRWNGKAYDGNANNSRDTGPYFTQCAMSLDTSRLVESITISSSTSGMTVCVFGITGVTADINAPTANAATNEDVDGNGAKFTASWSSVSNAGSYRLDVATDSNFTQIVKNSNTGCAYNNMSVSGTSHEVTGLQTNTTYYYRVRAVASNGGQSASSNVISITTPYTAKIQKADGSIQYYGSLDEALKNAASGDEIIVDGKANTAPVIKENVELKENVKLTIPSDKNITMANGASLSINGELENSGTLTVESGSKLENSGLISGAGNVQNNGNVTNKENGTFKTGVTNASSSTFTNEANSSWKEAGSNNTYYGPLDAALKETESKKTDITVSKNAEINGEATLGNGSTLTVTGNSRLDVTEKGAIQNNGTLNITNGSEMTNAGAITGSGNIANSGSIENKETGAILSGVKTTEPGNVTNKNDSQWTVTGEDGKIYYGSLDKALDDTKDKTADITLDNDVKITGDKKLGENVSINVPEDKKLTVSDDSTLTIPKNGNLNVEGSVDVAESGKIENNGTVDVAEDGNMTNAGQVTGTGDVANKGNIINEETGTILSGVTSTDSGKVENRNESHWSETVDNDKIYYGFLDKALDETKGATEKTDITLDKNAQINGDKELGENVSINVPEDKKLTVSDDSTLTISEKGNLNVEGSVNVSEKGNIKNNGNVSVDSKGTITNSGTIIGSDSGKIDNAGQIYNNNTGTILSDIKTDTSKNPDADVTNFNEASWTVTDKKTGEEKTYYGSLSDAAKDANAKSEETTEEGDKKYNSVIKADNDTKLNEDITLKDGVDLVVPDGTTVTVPEDTKLTISEGASLNNNGTLDIKQTGSLEIEGKLDVGETGDVSNSGELSGTGDVENKGTIVNDKTGTVKADNLSNVDNGTFKNKNDVSLTDKDGNVYYYSSLDEALKDARERVDDVVINIGSRINPTIEATGEDRIVEIPENVTIVIPENKQLTIANGTELDVRGKIENNGTILNSGTFVLIPESNLSGNGTLSNAGGASWKNPETGMAYYGPLKDALEKAGDQGTTEGKTDIKIDLEKDTEINEGTTIPGNVTVTIPEDKSLTVKAPAVLDVKGTLENEGNLNVSEGAGLNVSGIFDNKGTLDLEGNADLTVSNTGTFNNNGTVSSEAQWTDENGDKHYGTLKDALDSGAKDIELNKDTTLTEDTVIPEDTTVTVNNGVTITVPADKSLEINGKLEGANENTIINQNEVSWKNPTTGNGYYGSLKDALDKASKEEGNIDVTLDQDAKMDGDTSIPDNITLVVPENKNLDVSGKLDVAGKLENQGDVTVKDGADLTVSGTLENTGNINLETNAKLDVSEGGKLDNTGNISLKDGAAMDVSGTVENGGNVTTEGNATVKLPSGNEDSVNSNAEAQWTDKEGNTHFGTLNEALNENKKGNATDIILNNNATLTEDTVIPEDTTVTVKNGATITVPDNKSLEINGKLEGANENTIINQNEASWKNPETGKQFYGNLNDALTKTNEPENTPSQITVNKDAELDVSKHPEIPAGVTVEVKEGANLTLTGEGKLDVKGDILNNGKLTIDQNTSLEVSGKLENKEGASVENKNEAHWVDPETGNAYYGTLDEVLKRANEKATSENPATVVVDHNTTLKNDMNFDNIKLDVKEDAEISIENGVNVPKDVVEKIEKNNECTWKDSNGTHYGSLESALKNQTSGTIKVTKDAEIKSDVTVASGVTVEVPEDKTITIAKDKTMQVDGTIQNTGLIRNEGTMQISGSMTNKGTIANLDTIKSDKGSFVTNANGALMKGSGSIEISGNLINKGSISVEGTVKGITNKGSGKVQSDLESTLTKEHDYGAWIIDEKATATKEGRKHRVCEECGHTVYQEIPATGSESNNDSENTYKEVIQEVGAFDTNLNNQKKELFDGLLSADEKKEVDTFGSSAYIWLEVAPDQNTSPDDKQILEQTAKTLGDNVAVEYSEISLYKRVGFGDKERITDTQNLQISITIDIPEELTKYNKDEVVRKFYMLRAHDGEGAVIDNGIVSEDGTKFTFTTTLFSTYALAYIDSAKTSGGDDPIKPDEPNKPDNPSKPDNPGKPDNSGEANNGSNTGNSNGNSTSGGNTNTSNGTNISTGENNALNGSNGDLSIGQSGTSGKTNYKKTSGSKTNGSKENGKTPDQVASADNDSKKDNASTDSKNDNKGQEDAKNADSGQTSVAETIEKPSKKVEKQLKDAFSQIKKLDSEIQSGPYVQIDASNIESGRNNNDGKVKFILNIPEDIVADGRTFYLVTVDSEGNIVVLQNESLEDGVFSATGDPNATYQIVYEDGESTLAELVSEEGSLMDTNGNVISVKTVNTCFWHWIIAVLALIGVVLTLLARKNKQAMIVAAIDTVLMLVCVILGSCRWDIVTMLIGVVLLAAGIFIRTRRTSREVR